MLNIVNIVLVLFLFIIINHFLSYQENFECDVNLTSKETCFRRTQKQNGLKINEAKSMRKEIYKMMKELKKLAGKSEKKIAQNRQGVKGLQNNN
jgi:predicted Holliday junction resolvase-like endonuclease